MLLLFPKRNGRNLNIHSSLWHDNFLLLIMNRPGIVSALEEFKQSVYGENYHEGDDNIGAASKKRKAIADRAIQESANYDWEDLAENGKVKSIFSTFVE